jgi:hypothetical protein
MHVYLNCKVLFILCAGWLSFRWSIWLSMDCAVWGLIWLSKYRIQDDLIVDQQDGTALLVAELSAVRGVGLIADSFVWLVP